MEPLAWYRIVVQVVACAGLVVAAAGRGAPRLRFAVLGTVAAVGYAILQDQISTRLCPEYFTVFHPPIRDVTDPTLLGVTWGFLGAWWCGALLGYVVGLVATLGPRPPLSPRDLFRPVAILLGAEAVVAGLTGLTVWQHAELLDVTVGAATGVVPADRARWLLVVACYHFAAYAAAVVGSLVLCWWVRAERRKRTAPVLGARPHPPRHRDRAGSGENDPPTTTG